MFIPRDYINRVLIRNNHKPHQRGKTENGALNTMASGEERKSQALTCSLRGCHSCDSSIDFCCLSTSSLNVGCCGGGDGVGSHVGTASELARGLLLCSFLPPTKKNYATAMSLPFYTSHNCVYTADCCNQNVWIRTSHKY